MKLKRTSTRFAAVWTVVCLLLLPAMSRADDPIPQFYGVYTVHNSQLTELNAANVHLPFTPGDTGVLGEPAKVRIPSGRISFVIYLRQVAVNVPDAVWVNIVARLPRGKDIDPRGNITNVTQFSDLWKIRDRGYKFRVAPVAGKPDMIRVVYPDPGFVLPDGRYAFSIFGSTYDFIVNREDESNPEHCVERVSKAQNAFMMPTVTYPECPTSGGTVGASWHDFSDAAAGFAVSVPGTPEQQTIHLRAFGGSFDQQIFTVRVDGGVYASVTVFDWPDATSSAAEILATLAAQDPQRVVNGKLLGQRQIELNGVPGFEVLVSGANSRFLERTFVSGRHVVTVGVSALPQTQFGQESGRFVDSFKLLNRP